MLRWPTLICFQRLTSCHDRQSSTWMLPPLTTATSFCFDREWCFAGMMAQFLSSCCTSLQLWGNVGVQQLCNGHDCLGNCVRRLRTDRGHMSTCRIELCAFASDLCTLIQANGLGKKAVREQNQKVSLSCLPSGLYTYHDGHPCSRLCPTL